jgi:soluble lytic murein transglycosylase
MKRKRKAIGCGCFLVVAVIIVVAFGGIYSLRDSFNRFFYPLNYQDEISAAAAEYDMDKWLIFAIVREESRFRANASSSAGACGLMQLMPDTAAWLIEKAGFDMDPKTAIWDPEQNIQMGTWYISWLYHEYYGGELAKALAAYNAGYNNVNVWLEQGIWDGRLETAGDIPFRETADYLVSIMRNYDKYKELYSN